MLKKLAVGAGVAGVLSAGILLGGLTTGWVGAQTPHPPAPQGQPAPAGAAEAPDGAEQEAPVSLPASSVSQDAAQQAATAYVQQTAPYNSQGLTVTAVQVDDEDGTAVYKVTFSNASGQGAEVTVNPLTGKVLKAESETADANKTGDTGAETPAGQEQADADGPGGHADAPGAVDGQGGAQQ